MSEAKSDSTVLLSCPFCGYEPAGVDKIKNVWAVICLNCEYSGPPAKVKDAAILFWNTRKSRDFNPLGL